MANIMNEVKLKNKTSRNGFDLSKKNAFTAKIGELLPVYCKEVLPGDTFNISTKWMTRTQPVNTAAYTRIREYYDFFFVPTTMLWRNFDSFITGVDSRTRASGISVPSGLQDQQPYLTRAQIYTFMENVRDGSTPNNLFGFSRFNNTAKLLHYLGYGDLSIYDSLTNPKLNPFPLLAYQKIYQDYFRNQQWESAAPQDCNVDYLTGITGSSMQIPTTGINVTTPWNMFDLRYCNWNKDYFTGLLPNSQYGDAASLNLVGSGSVPFGPTSIYSQNLLLKDSAGNPITSGDNIVVSGTSTVNNNQVFTIKPETSQAYSQLYLTSDQVTALRNSLGLSSVSLDLTSTFTILALRQAQAKQKWAEITQSQRKDYKSQVEAHFGVSMSDAYSDICTWIGGVNGNIDISEVPNTNITETYEANIAGKGVGVGQGGVNFKANVHGYIMCIYHAVPLLDYSMTGVKRQNLKQVMSDYAIPEFDATGMVQIPLVELTNTSMPSVSSSAMLGYAPRYIDYKTDIDEVHGAFFNGGLGHWVAPFDDAYIKAFVEAQGQYFTGLDYRFFKVSPSVVNPIFGVNADSSVSTDQLLVNCAFNVKAARNLDRNGLPY